MQWDSGSSLDFFGSHIRQGIPDHVLKFQHHFLSCGFAASATSICLLCFQDLPSMSTENRADLDAGTALAVCDVLIQLLMLILVRVDLDPPGPNGRVHF